MELRTLLSAGDEADAIAVTVAGGHGAGCGCGMCSGETYVAPIVLPAWTSALQVDPLGFPPAPAVAGPGESVVIFDTAESEPNNAAAQATPITVGSASNTITGSIGPSSSDLDYFSFTLAQRSGVFFDIDSREIGLSTTLDTILTVYASNGTTQLGSNNDGDDFETFALNDTSATARSPDSALYVDLAAGSYFVAVSSASSTSGNYLFKARADSSFTSTVPVFSSRPGAADTLFLDFDGHSSTTDSWTTRDIDPNTGGTQANGPYTIAPFDFSGNPAEWSPGERAAIQNVWRGVAEDYAPFNVNVTTSYSGSFNNGVGFRQVIGNSFGTEVGIASGTLGVAFLSAYAGGSSNNNVAFTFANSFTSFYVGSAGNSGQIGAKAVEMANTSSHEFGHALGLAHYGGANPQTNGLMHTPDFGLSRERWKAGNTHSGEGTVFAQDDLNVISNATNTFGYRTDDHGSTINTATPMSGSGGVFTANGVIERITDLDFFSFTASGSTTLSVSMLEHIADLDAELRLYSSSGAFIEQSDPSPSIFANITRNLTPGTYYAEIRSDGGLGEIGQYTLNVTSPAVSTTPGVPDLLAATDTGSSSTDNLTNRDNSSAAKNLQFSVPGTIAGATVEILYDLVPIGSTIASGTTTTVTTNGTLDLADGLRTITARQIEPGKSASGQSAPLSITIDSVTPTADVIDVSPDPRGTGVGSVTIVFNRAVASFDLGDLTLTRNGGANLLTGANTLTTSDNIAFMLSDLSVVTNVPGTYVLTLTAAGSGISAPLPGTAMTANASDTWTNNNAAPSIGSVTDSPDPVVTGSSLTLSALNVTDSHGGPITVAFYRESNGSTGLQIPGDTAVGSDTTSPYSINITAPPSAGTYTYYARATDAGNLDSVAISTTNTVIPPPGAAPGAPDLLAATDSGPAGFDADDRTNFDNSTAAKRLQFSVSGTVSGATVAIYADNVAIGSQAATGTTTTVTTSGTQDLLDGVRSITARQTEPGKSESANSNALSITIDTARPTGDITDVSPDPRLNGVGSLTVTYSEAVVGFGLEDLSLFRNGFHPELTASQAPTSSDNITFTVSNLLSLTSIAATYAFGVTSVTSSGASPSMTDTAGNGLLVGLSEGWVHSMPAWLSAPGAAATWNSQTKVLNVTGPTTITADPGSDRPVINANVATAVLTINPTSDLDVRIASLNLSNGARATLSSLGGSRTATNHRVLVIEDGDLTIDSASRLDLADNDLVLDYDSSADPVGGVRDLLASGYNFGAHDGPGIVSSTALSNDPFTFTLGYADNASLPVPYGTALSGGLLPGGVDVDATSIIVKYTWVGDVTLDGVLDFQDLSIFNGDYDSGATTGRLWTEGDLSFDGLLDFQDLSLFNGTYDPAKPRL